MGGRAEHRNWSFGCALAGVAAIGLGRLRVGILVANLDGAFESDDLASGHDDHDHRWICLRYQAAVLNAWESAQQTLYGYLQAPWQQDRANLVAGQTAATLWPNLANYFVDPALKSEQTFLVGVKMGQLNGPTSFDLGTPKVSALTPTTATVAGCIYDTGTTTAAGEPGPADPWMVVLGATQAALGILSLSAARGRSPRSRPRRFPSAEPTTLATRRRSARLGPAS